MQPTFARLAVVVAALAIAADIGLARVGYGLVLPAIRRDLGGGYAVYDAVAAIHLGGYLAGTLAAPRLLRERARLPRITAVAHVVVAVFLVASALSPNALVLTLTRLAIGLASGVGIASAVTDALERVAPERRGFASALAWSAIGIALTVSSPAGAWTLGEAARWRVATALWALPAIAVTVLALRLPAQAHHEDDAAVPDVPFRWRDMLRASNVFFVAAYAAFGVAYIAFVTFAVAAFAARGISAPAVTLIWAACGIAVVCGALGIGVVLGSPAHRWSLAIPLLCGAAGSFAANLPGVAGATAGTVCVGLGLAATAAVASAFARERSDRATAARAFAAVTTVFGVGQLAGPLIAGAAADRFGLAAVPVFAGFVFLAGTLAASIDATR
ncbi:MAG TPA: YbfB/YjiJ family MFS transporter [Dongiaceae bacterium]|nr:YbfB/YjiJ family MFS transporter [Dongiaceae bacterium]